MLFAAGVNISFFHVMLYSDFISSCHINLLGNLLLPESIISVVSALKTCLALASLVQTLRMKFPQKNYSVYFLSPEKNNRETSLVLCDPATLFLQFTTAPLSLASRSVNQKVQIHTLTFFMCIYILEHTQTPTHTSTLSKILKICTPVGLACYCEAQSKFSAHF